MRINNNFNRNKRNLTLNITTHKILRSRTFQITMPNLRNSISLRSHRIRMISDNHTQNNFMDRSLLGQNFIFFSPSIIGINNFLKTNSLFFHIWNTQSPIMKRTTKCDSPIPNSDLPLLFILRLSNLSNQPINRINNLDKSLLHFLRSKLNFPNQTVNLINKKNRPDSLLQSLTKNSLSLWHNSF